MENAQKTLLPIDLRTTHNIPKAGHSDGMLRDSCTHLSVTHIDIVIFIMGPVGSKEECFEKTLKIRQMMLSKGEKEEN